jgi:hypothetical protein
MKIKGVVKKERKREKKGPIGFEHNKDISTKEPYSTINLAVSVNFPSSRIDGVRESRYFATQDACADPGVLS